MASTQNKTVEEAIRLFGLKGYKGIAFAIDAVTTQLDINVTQPAFIVFNDGTFLSTELDSTNLPGNNVNGTYHLYADYVWDNADQTYEVTYSASTGAAPSASAVRLADFTVAGNVITAITPVTALGTWTF